MKLIIIAYFVLFSGVTET